MVKKFMYTKTFKYDKSYDERIVNKIMFDVSIELNMKYDIAFEAPVTLHYAINEVEKYLSGKLTKTYLKGNPQINALHFVRDENWLDHYKIKGDLLGEHCQLEIVTIKDGIAILNKCVI